jgi:hypothetical protein
LDNSLATDYSSAEVVPLGLLVDSRGRLWVELPRFHKSDMAVWWVVAAAGTVEATVTVPPECRLRAVGTASLLCQTVRSSLADGLVSLALHAYR